jgi:predicted metalloenzyme YecM
MTLYVQQDFLNLRLTHKLQKRGFQFNQHDSCVASKMVNGKQLTLIRHVENSKVSHADVEVVNNLL